MMFEFIFHLWGGNITYVLLRATITDVIFLVIRPMRKKAEVVLLSEALQAPKVEQQLSFF